MLEDYLERAGDGATVELWCHAPPEILVERYRSRLHLRHRGYPGEAFLPELVALANRAEPLRRGPLCDVDTARPVDTERLLSWIESALAPSA